MNIAIIGCGYLGLELASLWSRKGHHVTATTRNPDRLSELSKHAQKSLIFKGESEEELVPIIANNDVLVVTIGADNLDQYEKAYLHTAHLFRHLALEMDLPRDLIYTSSTSVYGEHHGLFVDETCELLAQGDQGKILIEAEKSFVSLEELGWTVSILRLAEIYGPDRELSKRVRQLATHPLPGNGGQYTNMIHKSDCAAAIDYVLRHHLEGIYNLADDDHPTRKDLYDQISDKFGLPKVKWDSSLTTMRSGNKRVSNHKIKSEGFSFRHPHRVLD